MNLSAIVLVVLGCLVALAALAWLLFLRGPDLRPWLALEEPRIRAMGSERVLEVEFSDLRTPSSDRPSRPCSRPTTASGPAPRVLR